MKAVAEGGHEIGIHGYSHENPIAMTREQEIAVLDNCIELVTTLVGTPDWIRRAVVGVLDGHERTAARARHRVGEAWFRAYRTLTIIHPRPAEERMMNLTLCCVALTRIAIRAIKSRANFVGNSSKMC